MRRRLEQEATRLLVCGLLITCCWLNLSFECSAAEKTVRLRLAWGSGTGAKQRWMGEISIDGGVLTQLQPLGVETDAPVACRIDGSRIVVAPLLKRGFDGCDITVRADEQAMLRVNLRDEQTPNTAVFEAPLAAVITDQLRGPLDELGSFFLARRSPGDQLRVVPTREHWVFEPGEAWSLKLQPDLAEALDTGTILLDVQLRAAGESKPNWQSTRQLSSAAQLDQGVDFEIVCPAAEGAYRLTVTARHEENFATRFVPGQQARPIATREVEFVVIDPGARLPELVDQWLSVLTIDPANPSWWQRLPAWAQVPSLRNRSLGAVGNIRPVTRPARNGELVELPANISDSDPYWQAYTLPVREPGEPHLVEIEYPLGAQQHLAISVIEPDAAGRVTRSQQDASLYCEGADESQDGEVGVHRFLFWPRTRSPQLLLVNRHPSATGQYGKIRLLRQNTALAVLKESTLGGSSERLVAGYLAKPLLAESFGATEQLDLESGLSVQSWATFLDSACRLAQSLRLSGHNGVLLTVAADGSGLYPSQLINPSPRYDTGLLASSGQDPTRKDVLEMLLRVFDRERIRVIPTVQLAAPLPRLEALRSRGDSRSTGIACVGHEGQNWLDVNASPAGLAPYYNPLSDRVQAELAEIIKEISVRYGGHASLAGVAVQVSGQGYGLLPGAAWCFDDTTTSDFTRSTGIALPQEGAQRFGKRAQILLGAQRAEWMKWRMNRVSQLYTKLAEQVTAQRSDLRLLVATESLFEGPELQRRLRKSIAEPTDVEQILADHGLQLAELDAQSAVSVLVPHRLNASDELQARALDLRINSATEQGDLVPTEQRTAELFYHRTSRFRLPSFDQRSPFGPEQTFLTVTSQPQAAGANRRRHLVTTLVGSEPQTLVEGGVRLLPSSDVKLRGILQSIQALPFASVETRTQRHQPVMMRVYRTDKTTYVVLVNEAPWPTSAELKLTASRPSDWQLLGLQGHLHSDGAQPGGASASSAGTLSAGQQSWQLELLPYDFRAWSFNDEMLRVNEIKATISEVARQDLQQRIQAIESRASNLNIERPYAQLQNPGFELEDDGVRIVGWQPRQGAAGTIEVERTESHSGARALRLKSENRVGVAIQSHRFLAPDTGQLSVSAYLRVDQLDQDAQLRIAVQDQNEGNHYRQLAVLGHAELSRPGWLPYQFALTDVPFGQREQLRLHFHLTGSAEVLLDDVQLYDLRFDDARRRKIVRQIIAAKIALEQGQLVNCLRVVDDYWSRYLVEYVPPTDPGILQATRTPTVTDTPAKTTAEAEKPGIGSRLPSWVPKRWW